MLRPLCFAKWDKIFYFSGQQWLGVPDRFIIAMFAMATGMMVLALFCLAPLMLTAT